MRTHAVKIRIPVPERTASNLRPPRYRGRLWALLHAHSLLLGPPAEPAGPAFAEDDYRRLAGRRDDGRRPEGDRAKGGRIGQ